METQTRFDLDAAIANWQSELTAQPELTPIVRRELETHLRDTIAELQKRGLNNEESFWLARRRVGHPELLSEEFAKADSANVWRERIFWMAAAMLAVNLWSNLCNPFWVPQRFIHTLFSDMIPGWLLFYLPSWLGESHVLYPLQIISLCLRSIPIILVAVFLAKGRLKFSHAALHFFGASRKRFLVAVTGAFLFANSVNLFGGDFWPYTLYHLVWTLPLILLTTWLIPPKKKCPATA